jgi:magnesium chelatase family protein
MDRIDIHVDVPAVKEESLVKINKEEGSSSIRVRVEEARMVQLKRFKDCFIKTNGEMNSAQVRRYCRLTDEATDLLKRAISRLSLSARSYFKIIKVAQSIADINRKNYIETSFVAEALQYRMKEK